MACLNPRMGWPDLRAGGRLTFDPDRRRDLGACVFTRCRGCLGCRLDAAAEWTVRCEHEAHTCGGRSAFVTLTFDDAHFPHGHEALVREVKLFVKRLRKRCDAGEVRTFGCVELGTSGRRPHAHLLVFGATFERGRPVARGAAGSVCWQSDELDRLWSRGGVSLGHASFGEFTRESAGYVARYTMARRSANDVLGQLELVPHPLTGVLYGFRPSWRVEASKGLGRAWVELFGRAAVEQGAVIGRGGVRSAVPRWYGREVERLFGAGVGASAECVAQEHVLSQAWNSTPERLAVRGEVLAARTRSLKRGAL